MSDVVMNEAEALTSLVADPEQIRNAFAGWRAQEKYILSILARADPEQINDLRQSYTAAYGGDISKALDSKATGFEMYMVFCILDSTGRDAQLANGAILKGDYYVLIEIACTRSSLEFLLVKQAYHARYKKSVEEDVAYHLTSKYRKLLLPLVGSFRYSGPEVDMNLAEAEAKILYEKISEEDYSNMNVIWILATRSKAQVNATLACYRNAFKKDISKDLKADPNNQFLHILRTAVKCLTRPEKYFGKVLFVAINGQNRDEVAIARVLSTRAKIDMKLIIEEYRRKNGPLLLQLQTLAALVHNF